MEEVALVGANKVDGARLGEKGEGGLARLMDWECPVSWASSAMPSAADDLLGQGRRSSETVSAPMLPMSHKSAKVPQVKVAMKLARLSAIASTFM